ncbi:hypothetical protein ONS95_009464 [Cadophora gregata]|uniref:uncharacterized protein n=1 Tax=Cadophora gregata TaxID=51156 RepID=UPI0026DD86EB|nr:uncharacterized protein ONS95_009464 [Cadophora gregata]KAK0124515.1 hypothetical protein ONS95_009464 [Cadophora gregata]KAK0129633.1 hypothetical protein ONS96_000197 [Cadophora gregata f. sp. sojae]
MSDDSPSPSKRRRTKGTHSFAMSTPLRRPAPERIDYFSAPYELVAKPEPKGPVWPPNQLPVELFTLIVSYLPRSGVQNMRLINKEFDLKVSEALFRIVVVPFRPEIYGITPETTGPNDTPQGSIMLQDQGMRVFQGFGRWIKRFAMSFEIDHAKLASPPRKSDQEVIMSFWGLYRWPFKTYNRYSQLEGLEQTADETRTMAKALKYISDAKELGLSIDGGLGWLAGPDINQRVAERGEKPVVFGASKFVPEPKVGPPRGAVKAITLSNLSDSQSEYGVFLRMVLEAGISQDDADAAVQMLQAETRAAATASPENSSLPNSAHSPLIDSVRRSRRQQLSEVGVNSADIDTDLIDLADVDDDVQQTSYSLGSISSRKATRHKEMFPLKPNELTNAQREMLLEMEWAQNAFMQSWAIAIMDNHDTFKEIAKLNIARLPSKHLSILRREDFWDSLPNLKCLTLAIIPDWREVKKEATSWVQDTRIPPSNAVTAVYDLLTQQIGRREHIKELQFEWLCGGEYAPGLFARNQHILAAPVVSNAMYMVNRSQQHPVLDLPYIERLILKNCWISPHILSRFLGPMRKGVLQSISFDSVSLTAMVPQSAHPNPLTAAAMAQNAQVVAGQAAANNLLVNLQGMQGGFNGPLNNQNQLQLPPPVVAPVNTVNVDWLDPPRAGSWVEIINSLTPGQTLEDIRYAREIGPEPRPRVRSKLTRLSFTSCGYVRIPLDFDQTALEPMIAPPPHPAPITKRITELDPHMMKPLDAFTLGAIINHIDPAEAAALENAWDMTVGWRLSRPELMSDAVLDGFMSAGLGRFDGTIEVVQPPSRQSF